MKNQLLKNSMLWFLFLPILVITICGFFIPLGYDSFQKNLVEQHAIENKIKLLRLEIRSLLDQPKTEETQHILEDLYVQLDTATIKLADYKTDWGPTATGALKLYCQKGMSAAGNVYQPFLFLMALAFLFLLVAITTHRKIPFYVRLGSMSTGSILFAIIISQWIFATLYAPERYTKIVGALLTPIVITWTIGCIVVFIRNFCILGVKGHKKY